MLTCPACPVTVACDRRSRLPSVVALTPLHCVAGCPRGRRIETVHDGGLLFFFSLLAPQAVSSRAVKVILCSVPPGWETERRDDHGSARPEKPLHGALFVAAAIAGSLLDASGHEPLAAAEPVGLW